MSNSPPIQNLDTIDILAARRDGGVVLIIVASSRLNGSPEHQKLLLDKIDGYLGYIGSLEFRGEFENPPAEKIAIVLRYAGDPHPVMFTLFEKCEAWVRENGARFRAEPLGTAG